MKTIIPARGYALIELLDTQKTSASGLVIPDETKQRQAKGKILVLGLKEISPYQVLFEADKARFADLPHDFNENDIVWFKQFGGEKIKEDGKEYYLVPYKEIIATVK